MENTPPIADEPELWINATEAQIDAFYASCIPPEVEPVRWQVWGF